MWTRTLATADASCGGKAFGLARLIAAGLPVPDGFVLDHRAFRVATGDVVRVTGDPVQATLEPDPGISLRLSRAAARGGSASTDAIGHTLDELARRVETIELPRDLVDEVNARARELGGPFAVRSSATIEDGAAGAAAGVFSSRTAVPIDALWPAIRAVWISALTPLAATYAHRRGGEISISVIVQRFVDGERMTVYTRPPGAPEQGEVWRQIGGALTKVSRRGGRFVDAEAAIGAQHGADLELIIPRNEEVEDLDHACFVQARPIVHPVIARRQPPPPVVLSILDDGRRWKLDLAHNPDPLSVAQTDLVHRVEADGKVPWVSRVVAGYLYTSPREQAASTQSDRGRAGELWNRYAEIGVQLAACLGYDRGVFVAHPLDDALDRYVQFIRQWAGLSTMIAQHRPTEPVATHRPSSLEAMLLDAARANRDETTIASNVGLFAPSWDVATPTFAERPGLLRDALARAKQALLQVTPAVAVDPDDADASLAFMVAELAELDDQWFARAQQMVRRAILDRADELGIPREDAFWIPLDDLVTGELDPIDVRRRASGARAAATRAATWSMPIVVGDASLEDRGVALRGIGNGHQITGRVRRFESLASAIVVGHGDIVVTRAVTPALAVIVIGCAAIISETGGLLDHGAAMARELGIPCIVGCRDAWSQLADGMIVSLDNDQVTIK